jgi:antitoxin (DNA-binding transcriptional repressor) of toxin-antitoxin stability system
MQLALEELTVNIKELLQTIQQHEPIMLMYRGNPQAKIVSLNMIEQPLPDDLSQSPLLEIWKDREDCQDILVDNLRQAHF